MMILTRRLAITLAGFAAFAAFTLAGCDDSTSQLVSPTASSLIGYWSRGSEVPGSSEDWTLALTGTSIVVHGSWTGEACCAGSITGTGNIVGDSIHVDLKFFDASTTGTPRFTEHVDAVQSTIDDILGTATRDSSSAPIHLKRAESPDLSAAGGA